MKTNLLSGLKRLSFFAMIFSFSNSIHAQNYNINTVAGNGVAGFAGDNGQATAAEIQAPYGVNVDASGNIYIPDNSNQRVRMVNNGGIITTIVGNGTAGFSGDGGQATACELNFPSGIVTDASGNIFISDGSNDRIRKVLPSGVINTMAGNGTAGFSGDGGQATAAEIHFPAGLTIDGSGNLYISDVLNQRIRKISAGGVITTFAGNGTSGFSGDGGQATNAELGNPFGVVTDASGNVYIADQFNHRIRKVDPSGVITTVAGNGVGTFAGDGGQATAASLNRPFDVLIDAAGNLYIADFANNRIRKVSNSGVITTIAGTGAAGFSGDGGPATAAALSGPTGITMDVNDNLYITDQGNNRVRKLTILCSLTAGITSSTNVLCNGAATGRATVTPASGAAPYVYSWAPSGGTNATANNLTAGTYTATVTDNFGCVATASVTITQPPALINNANATNPTICVGQCTDINAVPSGGTGSYTYSWNVAGTSASVNVCPASTTTYTSTVTDANGCTTTASVVVTVNTCAGVPGVSSQSISNMIYPNPVSNIATLTFGETGTHCVQVLDMIGRQVYEYSCNGTEHNIACDGLSPGIYFVRITSNSGIQTLKMIKQ